jgi:hypothetical protein
MDHVMTGLLLRPIHSAQAGNGCKGRNLVLSGKSSIKPFSNEIKRMDKEPMEMGLSEFEYAFYTAIAATVLKQAE